MGFITHILWYAFILNQVMLGLHVNFDITEFKYMTSRENPILLKEIILQEILQEQIVKGETKDLSKTKYIICIFHQNNDHGYAYWHPKDYSFFCHLTQKQL